MTTGAASLRTGWTSVVLSVIEFDVKAFVETCGKTFQWRIVAADIGMTDGAQRYRRRRELSAMTVGARFVTGKAWCGRVVCSFVTRVAGERTVALAVVKKF